MSELHPPIYRETLPHAGHEHDCPYIDLVWDDTKQEYVDRVDVPLPEHIQAAVRALVAKEYAERLFRMPTQSDGVN